MTAIPLPPPAIHHSTGDAIIQSSSKECLDRSRKLLADTNDMVDPMMAGKPVKRPILLPNPTDTSRKPQPFQDKAENQEHAQSRESLSRDLP